MNELESWRAKASAHASTDRIGHVIARYFDLIGAVGRDGVGAESVGDLVGMLAQDRAFAVSRDKNETTPLRELVYAMAASLGTLVEDLAKKNGLVESMKMEDPADAALYSADNEYLLPKEEPNGLSPDAGRLPSIHEDQMERERRERDRLARERAGPSDEEQRASSHPSRKRQRLQPVQHDGANDVNVVNAVVDEKDEDEVVELLQKCDVCSRMFGSVASLMNHLATCHREPPRSDAAGTSKAAVASAVLRDLVQTPVKAAPMTSVGLPAGLPMIPLPPQTRPMPMTQPLGAPPHIQPIVHAHPLSQPGGSITSETSQETHKHHCQLCPAKFRFPSGLRDHMFKHTGERPYQCPVCTEAFVNASLLKSHKRVDHGMLPYPCPGCDAKFSMCNELTHHKKSTGHG